MPVVTPVPGASPAAPAIPVAGPLGHAARPGVAAGIEAAGDRVDQVSLSPAALLQQALAAPGIAVQRLGALLWRFEQADQLAGRAAPLALGALAAEIGAAASELGTAVRALLPPAGEVSTLSQIAGAATLRALGTLAPAPRQTGDTEPVRGGEPSADGAGPDRMAPPADPAREAQAAAGAALRDAAGALSRMRLRLDAAPTLAAADDRAVAQAPGPGHGATWCEAQIALAQAQVARAARAVEPRQVAASRRWRIAARPHQPGVALAGAPGRYGQGVGAGALLALLCAAVTALWAASRLDLTLARVAAAVLLALAGLAWSWRRGVWRRPRRIRIELRR